MIVTPTPEEFHAAMLAQHVLRADADSRGLTSYARARAVDTLVRGLPLPTALPWRHWRVMLDEPPTVAPTPKSRRTLMLMDALLGIDLNDPGARAATHRTAQMQTLRAKLDMAKFAALDAWWEQQEEQAHAEEAELEAWMDKLGVARSFLVAFAQVALSRAKVSEYMTWDVWLAIREAFKARHASDATLTPADYAASVKATEFVDAYWRLNPKEKEPTHG